MRIGPPVAAIAAAIIVSATAAEPPSTDVDGLLARVAQRVEAYFARAQSIICLETVRLQRLTPDLVPEGFARRLEYDLHVSWEPAIDPDSVPKANMHRELRAVNGRTPRTGDEPECLDPKPVSLDPLEFLLPGHQGEYTFTYKGLDRVARRDAARLEYVVTHPGPPEATWQDTCVTLSLPARTKGRVWIDVASGDVLRLEEHMQGPHDVAVPHDARRFGGESWLTFERGDFAIRYKPVTFSDPDEIVMLPESTESTSVARGSRLRITRTFSDYRRFVTDVKIVR